MDDSFLQNSGAGLSKVAASYNRVGAAKILMDDRITVEFFDQCNKILENDIQQSTVSDFKIFLRRIKNAIKKARKNVQSIRLTYDAARHRLKTARPDKIEANKAEVEKAEDEFVAAVEDAMSKMRNVSEHPTALKLMTDFVNAQLAYHKEAFEVLFYLDTWQS